jgi:hypothetical protein
MLMKCEFEYMDEVAHGTVRSASAVCVTSPHPLLTHFGLEDVGRIFLRTVSMNLSHVTAHYRNENVSYCSITIDFF